jgi:hypothetical protein
MAQIINTRSPFYIKVSDSTLAKAELKLYIYEGTKDVTPDAADLKYTIEKAEISASNYVVFEISELIRDYINNQYDGEYDSYAVWVNPVITALDASNNTISSPTVTPSTYSDQFIATDGYGYFDEGINPDIDKGLMMTPATLYRVQDRSINVPVYAETTNSVVFRLNGETVYSKTISDNDNTDQKIQYIASDSNSTADSYKERVLEDGGIFEDSRCLRDFDSQIEIGEIDEVYVNYTKDSLTKTHVLKVKTFDCSKYEPVRVTFVNKYGALQDIYFTKRSDESINVKTDDYKASVMDFDNFSYNTSSHQMRTLNLVGNESVTLNTDYIDESCNEHIRQLMFSEQIWMTKLTDKEEVVPLKLANNSLQLKKRVNDKLVQYTMQFDLAFDKINTIR